MKKFLISLGHACNGIRYAVTSERNIKIQLTAFALVMVAAFLLHIPRFETLVILGMSALVLSLELTNTAVERLADKVSPEHDAQIRIVKDVIAGAVLMASLFAIIIGISIFAEPLIQLLEK